MIKTLWFACKRKRSLIINNKIKQGIRMQDHTLHNHDFFLFLFRKKEGKKKGNSTHSRRHVDIRLFPTGLIKNHPSVIGRRVFAEEAVISPPGGSCGGGGGVRKGWRVGGGTGGDYCLSSGFLKATK